MLLWICKKYLKINFFFKKKDFSKRNEIFEFDDGSTKKIC